MKIRELQEDERYLLKEFTYQSLYVSDGEKPYSRDILDLPEIRMYYEDFDLNKNICLISEDHNRCVGMIWGHLWDRERKGYGYFREDFPELSLAVAPEYRHQGIGRKLLETFLEKAKLRGIQGVSLSVSYGNFAKGMYESVGFKVLKERDTDILMAIFL